LETANASIIGRWDEKHVARLLGNLVGNAVKYSPGGGAIDLRLSREFDGTGEWAVLSVQDSGVGIPLEDLPHVFEPLYRATNVHAIPGTGIGLAW